MRFFRRPSGPRVFFATDIHGSDRCFRKWLNAAAAYRADVLILGGDITGKAVVPVIANADGWVSTADGRQVHASTEDELAQLRRRIRDTGHYDVLMSPSEAREVADDADKLDQVFLSAARERLKSWVTLAEERLADRETSCFMMLGNDEPPELADIIRASSRVIYSEDRVQELPGGFEMVSYGVSPPTPWNTARELPDEEIGQQLAMLIQGIRKPQLSVFNVHCPPADSHLDQAPDLDSQMRIKGGIGGRASRSVGSHAVRDLICRVGPMLGLHGHVHESAGVERIGRTVCLNPGSEYPEGLLRGAIVQFGDSGLESWQLVQG